MWIFLEWNTLNWIYLELNKHFFLEWTKSILGFLGVEQTWTYEKPWSLNSYIIWDLRIMFLFEWSIWIFFQKMQFNSSFWRLTYIASTDTFCVNSISSYILWNMLKVVQLIFSKHTKKTMNLIICEFSSISERFRVERLQGLLRVC